AKAQQWEQAITVWSKAETVTHSIEDIYTRDNVLSELARELAKAQQWEQAEIVAHSTEDSQSRVEILQEISKTLDRVGKHEQTLRFVQHAWLHADTKAYAISLLPLATGLILLKPEIGSDIYEAFTWVDTFLKE